MIFFFTLHYSYFALFADNLIEVKTDSSVEFSRIGAKGVNCLLHVSPWGLTLVLQVNNVKEFLPFYHK